MSKYEYRTTNMYSRKARTSYDPVERIHAWLEMYVDWCQINQDTSRMQ